MPIQRKVNKDFFKEWSPDMAYVLGFFAADGSMYETKRGTKYLDFTSVDKELIEQVKTALDSEHKIGRRATPDNHQDVYHLQIGSKDMFSDLRSLGITPRKTRILSFPDVPKEFTGDFVRGYFDGDGTVWVGTIHASREVNSVGITTRFTSSSVGFLEDLSELLAENAGMGKGSLSEADKAHSLQYSISDSLLLYEVMYGNLVSDLFLSRKREKFEIFLKSR
ncbi:MAG: LAGLIDADG family homing endonuclease [Candidatus Paceibacterota bacterium]